MKLVLIEGPGKKDSVQHYLGKGYKVMPTFGHCRDLPEKGLGVDVHNNFAPEYVVVPDHKKTVDAIKAQMQNAEAVYFASDPDREGEAIAWHMCYLLGIDPNSDCRITYNEISEAAVNEAIKHPRPIDNNLVNAQQARRVLDRLVGYKISPILCKKIQNKLSAGRVQSVTLRLVVDREREIENFKPEEYWTLQVVLSDKEGKETFKANLNLGKNQTIKTKEEMDKVLSDISGKEFLATEVKKSVTKSQPSAPFTTSSMQQEALNKLGMSLKTTSATAQVLYEGVEIAGRGKQPLVTYIRTDSTRVAPEAQAKAKAFIQKNYGADYVAPTRVYKNKKDAQDAHEAIRPISLDYRPEDLKDKIQKNEYRLYKLIYDRFLASQMSDAKYNSLSVDLECGGHKFKTTGRTLLFDGYTALYNNQTSDDEENSDSAKLPNIEKGDKFDMLQSKPEQKWTKPPARYTEASLVKAMEEKGIGRPSTYTQSVSTIFAREYVEKQGKSIVPTELGKVVVDMLIHYFPDIMDVGFTADMENKLDDIEYDGKDWHKVLSEFYDGFEDAVKNAVVDKTTAKIPDEVSDVQCDQCGAMMVIRSGRYGKFLACPNYPTCKNTKPFEKESPVVAKCPICGKNVKRLKSKKGKFFYGCEGYPTCTFMSWDIPANEKCPNCGKDMIVKFYKNSKVISCPECKYNRRENIENETANVSEENENSFDEIDILNKLDEQNEI